MLLAFYIKLEISRWSNYTNTCMYKNAESSIQKNRETKINKIRRGKCSLTGLRWWEGAGDMLSTWPQSGDAAADGGGREGGGGGGDEKQSISLATKIPINQQRSTDTRREVLTQWDKAWNSAKEIKKTKSKIPKVATRNCINELWSDKNE